MVLAALEFKIYHVWRMNVVPKISQKLFVNKQMSMAAFTQFTEGTRDITMLRKDLCMIIDESFGTTLFFIKDLQCSYKRLQLKQSNICTNTFTKEVTVFKKKCSIQTMMIKGSSMKFSSILMVDMSVPGMPRGELFSYAYGIAICLRISYPSQHAKARLSPPQYDNRRGSGTARMSEETTLFFHFFRMNAIDELAKQTRYQDFSLAFTWNQFTKIWSRRCRGYAIGRIYYISPKDIEQYYLRKLPLAQNRVRLFWRHSYCKWWAL